MFSSEASLRTPDSSQLAGPTATLTRKQQKGFLTLTAWTSVMLMHNLREVAFAFFLMM